MSKTKEEILGPPAYSHECGSFIEVDTRQEVLKAMDAWADQKLEEYKEKIRKIFEQRPVMGPEDSSWQEGYIQCFNDLEKQINEV